MSGISIFFSVSVFVYEGFFLNVFHADLHWAYVLFEQRNFYGVNVVSPFNLLMHKRISIHIRIVNEHTHSRLFCSLDFLESFVQFALCNQSFSLTTTKKSSNLFKVNNNKSTHVCSFSAFKWIDFKNSIETSFQLENFGKKNIE